MEDLARLSKDELERYWHEHHRIAFVAEALSVERAEALFGEKRMAEYRERCEALQKGSPEWRGQKVVRRSQHGGRDSR